ncbi:GTP-binding protein Rho1 [Boothiomyces macroporosus]|uniref:GTP-binding protein Rho1 n=1 Tax=Boothiomyces macroporosus TaxID=261099 RepID=A0AAD5Y358_9FUNG|nr:GTP-binding protein Rho1 [Boothiomyces macroporosus]
MRESSDTSLDKIRKKLVIVGDGAIGKTALLMVQSGQPYPENYLPTIFENYVSKIQYQSKTVELSLWDTAGQEDYDRLRPLSYPDTDIILLAFAICNPDSFDNITEKWHPETKHFLPNTTSILVGLKKDLRNDPAVIEELAKKNNKQPITYEQGVEKAHSVGAAKYFECSAKTGEGIQELFNYVAKASLYNKKKMGNCKML